MINSCQNYLDTYLNCQILEFKARHHTRYYFSMLGGDHASH